jgi:hypothetical protein
LPEDDLKNLRPLIEKRFATMQEFVSQAVAYYAQPSCFIHLASRSVR